MGSVIVCGFYTPDYHHWVVPLVASLDQFGQSHDFVLAEKAGQMWETNTMAKARHILAAMDRHPDKVIVWLDVDCIVHGDLSPLADIRGDVAFRMYSKFRRHHKGARFRAQSGTMVFRPTAEARQFVEHWKRASENAAVRRDRPVIPGGRDGGVDWLHVCTAAPEASTMRWRSISARLAICPHRTWRTPCYSSSLLAGDRMKARKLLSDATFDPAELKAIGRAFDDAWEQVSPHVDARPEAIEAARLKLAEIMLGITRDGTRDPDRVIEQAVRQMLAGPTTIGPKR